MPAGRKSGKRKRRINRRQRKLNFRQKQQVKRLIGNKSEKKHIIYNLAGGSIDAGGTIVRMPMPSAGVDDSQRIAEEIMLEKLTVRASMLAGDSTNFLRLIVFRWSLDNNITAPVITDILEVTNFMAFLNETNVDSGKIKVLYDRTFPLVTGGTNQAKMVNFHLYGRRLGRKKMFFGDIASTLGQHQLYWCAISDSAVAPNPTLNIRMKLYYTDS